MSALGEFHTRSEINLARLESLGRPLTDEESDELRRALHAVYCRHRSRALAMHEREERELLARLQAEAYQ